MTFEPALNWIGGLESEPLWETESARDNREHFSRSGKYREISFFKVYIYIHFNTFVLMQKNVWNISYCQAVLKTWSDDSFFFFFFPFLCARQHSCKVVKIVIGVFFYQPKPPKPDQRTGLCCQRRRARTL